MTITDFSPQPHNTNVTGKWPQNLTAFLLLTCIILLTYSNTFNASWHFDDYHSIVNNPRINLRTLNIKDLQETLYAGPESGSYAGTQLFRPISNITFALNWYFTPNNVLGFHVINIAIHITCAFFLFLTTRLLLSISGNRTDNETTYSIALLATVFWAINPVQTQAITYIVQRMASLAALFSIITVFCYLRGRIEKNNSVRKWYFITASLSFLLALGAKENTAALPASIFLIEWIFFPKTNQRSTKWLKQFILPAFFIATVVVAYLLYTKLPGILSGYSTRPFSLSERLLTEARIILFYLSQLLYPSQERLSLVHDITLSTSLSKPWTTGPALFTIFAGLSFAVTQSRKYPLFSFALLFFFLNHIIESTFIPLELIFEHRNYMPSFFLFLPFSALFHKFLLKNEGGARQKVLTAALGSVLLIIFGMNTYARNMTWKTEETLWLDARKKAPLLARPVTTLAGIIKQNPNRLQESLDLYQTALNLNKPAEAFERAHIYYNIADTYFKMRRSDKIELYCKAALELEPKYEKARYLLGLSYLMKKDIDSAEREFDRLLTKRPSHHKYLFQKGVILIHRNNYPDAANYFLKSSQTNTSFLDAQLGLGFALGKMGNFELADSFLQKAATTRPYDLLIQFALLENSLGNGNTFVSDLVRTNILKNFSKETISQTLKAIDNDRTTLPFSSKIISSYLSLPQTPEEK